MRKRILLVGVILIFGLVAYIDSPEETYHGFRTNLHVNSNVSDMEESEEAFMQVEEEAIEVFSTVTHELDDMFRNDGYIIEKYRQYELYENENGVIVKKVPTSYFDFLRYKRDELNLD